MQLDPSPTPLDEGGQMLPTDHPLPETGAAADPTCRPPGDRSAPTGFGRLARKLASRTTDLIALGLITIAALTIGRQISGWWNTDPTALDPLANLPASQPDWGSGAVLLEFGDSPVAMHRELFRGEGEQAIERLIAVCLADAENAAPPPDPPEPAERKMLDYLATLPPLIEAADGERVHFVPIPVPMAVASRDFGHDSVSSGGSNRDNETSATGTRVVSWGVAMRQGEQDWTLFVFRSGRTASAVTDGIEIELPPGSRRTLALRGVSGEQFVGFAGAGPAAEWARHFDALAARQGWRVTVDWRTADGEWTRGFEAVSDIESPGRSSDKRRSRIEMHFGPDRRGGVSGLISVNPMPEQKANQ